MSRFVLFALAAAWIGASAAGAATVGVGYVAVRTSAPGDPWAVTHWFEPGDTFIHDDFMCRGTMPPVFLETVCDDADRPADVAVAVSVMASIHPLIDMTVVFTDFGQPTPLDIVFSLPVPPMTGRAEAVLEGFVTTPAAAGAGASTSPAPDPAGTFFAGAVGDAVVLSLGRGPIAQTNTARTTLFGPVATHLACGGATVCDAIALLAGLGGLGGGQTIVFGARFDLDPAPPVPLPLPGPMLAAALAGLAALRRLRRQSS